MSKRDKTSAGALVYGGVPRANLMPPEVGIRRKEAAQRRLLITITIMVATAMAATIVASFFYAGAAEQRLADERRVTEELLTTQLEFGDITQIRGDIQAITGLRSQLATTEVLWAEVLAPYLSMFSEADQVQSISVTSNAPAQPELGITGPLRQPRVVSVTLTISSSSGTVPWAWIRTWEQFDSYADSSIDSIASSEGVTQTVLTLNLNDSALSGRFAPEGAAPADESNEEDQ